MHLYFSHNMATSAFYLAYCVFPTETQQFPHRLVHTPWHLADNARREVVGFSGTKDNHRLLPSQVHLSEPPDPKLRATDGKMLHLLLGSQSYTTLEPQVHTQFPRLGAGRRACV
jgi:hypothetical protein